MMRTQTKAHLPIAIPNLLFTILCPDVYPTRLSELNGLNFVALSFLISFWVQPVEVVAGDWKIGMVSAEYNCLCDCIPPDSFLFQRPHLLSGHHSPY